MIGHAAAAEWLRTLPWWDWRGWSDWFYGGQAIGVNYPPLGHAWMRFTDPVHGQMAAVAIGLLVILPWGALRLSRAVGCVPRQQRAAVGAVLVLTAAASHMHWVLSGFHHQTTFYGSWPAMIATVIGLHVAAWAARCRRPITCGAVAGVAVLFNATVVPGIAVVCVVLLATSGTSLGRIMRWAATAAAAALSVCSWWLVPFIAGWDRLVRWEVRLSNAWESGGVWQTAVLAVLAAAAVWAARIDAGPARRLALVAGAGLLGVVLADLFGYLRPERWLELPVVVAAMAGGFLAAGHNRDGLKPIRPAWSFLGVAFLIVLVVVTLRLELLPLAAWLMWGSRRTWAWSSALAWTALLAFVPLVGQVRNPAPSALNPPAPLEAVSERGDPDAAGLVYVDRIYNTSTGDVDSCGWGYPWRTTMDTAGRIRPLFGLYRETSAAAEFLSAEVNLRVGSIDESGRSRPNWFRAWADAGSPSLDTPARAEALGARWYVECGPDESVTITELPGTTISGVAVVPVATDTGWHRTAVEWWVSLGTPAANGDSSDVPLYDPGVVPILSTSDLSSYPRSQVASGARLAVRTDRITVHADEAGWAWLRVPWDPGWSALNGTPVHKGGPGHLVVWADRGTTELCWGVPSTVNASAATLTGVALLATAVLTIINRRRGWQSEPTRSGPVTYALATFADTVDDWAVASTQKVRRVIARFRQG